MPAIETATELFKRALHDVDPEFHPDNEHVKREA